MSWSRLVTRSCVGGGSTSNQPEGWFTVHTADTAPAAWISEACNEHPHAAYGYACARPRKRKQLVGGNPMPDSRPPIHDLDGGPRNRDDGLRLFACAPTGEEARAAVAGHELLQR
jgi:hypothetical protein